MPAPSPVTVVGVDVGGPRKGYHAVALGPRRSFVRFHSHSAAAIAAWCVEQQARAVAVDAPCRWRAEGQRARAAERELAAHRISCFSTPTRARALGHAFYTWMFAGEDLYSALRSSFPLYDGAPAVAGPVCFETYPQAIACALSGTIVSAAAKTKRAVRSDLLARAGLDPEAFPTVDEVDAALCALTARQVLAGRFQVYGDAASGCIVVPRDPLTPATPARTSRAFARVLRELPALTADERARLRASL